MQQHNVPQFVALLKERKFPVDGMQLEVVATADEETDGFRGIITMEGEDWFSLQWCKWDCFLILLSTMDMKRMFKCFLPYCLGLCKKDSFEVGSEMGMKLRVVRSIKYS